MKKILPRFKFSGSNILFSRAKAGLPKLIFGLFAVILFFVSTPGLVSAQSVTPTVTTAPSGQAGASPSPDPAAANWVQDSEVSFVGKTGVRSDNFLTWTLQNYSWLCVKKIDVNRCDNTNDPLLTFYHSIQLIVYGLIALFVLATAFVIIITRGQNTTVMRFIPLFVVVMLLITFSFSIIQIIYEAVDVIQGFFLRIRPTDLVNPYITTKDLLYIGFDYNFVGYRLIGPMYDESAFISLLLVRLTAITYYVMTGILLIRKIILWFFIIISPIFPLLLFYKPIRNTAKIWIGEFFRWLLYAPLFAIFLHGLVVVWQKGIPLAFDFSGALAGDTVYPTAVNILLGGPGQAIAINNSVNLSDTFALYVVALLMLWVVILLPFLLLKIFLDFLATISLDNNVLVKKFGNPGAFLSGPRGAAPSPSPLPGQFQPEGRAKTLPFFGTRQAAIPVKYQSSVASSVKESTAIMQSANLSIPRMRDIAHYETSLMSRDKAAQGQVSSFHNTLAKIANPAATTNTAERQKFTSVREKLLEQKQKGNPIASSVLSASQSAVSSTSSVTSHTQTATVQNRSQQVEHVGQMLKLVSNPNLATTESQRQQVSKLKADLMEKKAKGDKLAASILDTQDKLSQQGVPADQKEKMEGGILDQLLEAEKTGNNIAQEMLPQVPVGPVTPQSLPAVNRVQQVSLEDYEEVRKLWTENYQTIEPPKGLNGELVDRREWIKNDTEKINAAIALLSSIEPEKINNGMSMVSSILPFLLMGGFSKSEVVAYLKAKMEAGKQVLSDIERKETEESSTISTVAKKVAEPQTLKAEIEEPKELGPDPKNNDNQ